MQVQCEQEGYEMFCLVLDLLRHKRHTECTGYVHCRQRQKRNDAT